MTDAELDDRLERLSEEDLHGILSHDYTCWLYDNVNRFKLDKRMAREILDMRMRLTDEEKSYWKGHAIGCEEICLVIQRVLDGKDTGGTCPEPWESVRRRLLALVQEKK